MKKINISIKEHKVGELFYNEQNREFGFNYISEKAAVSLTMPYKKSTYVWPNSLHPIFEMNLPEGYLFEIFKNFLAKKYGYINDFLIFSYLAPNIESRLNYQSEFDKKEFDGFDINEVLNHDNQDTFVKLLNLFLDKNAISGIQPKTIVLIKQKESLVLKEYIVKTWGDEYPHLAENEYFCMKAVEYSGVPIPQIYLSKNKNFLLVEKFNYDKEKNEYIGFEEVLSLQGKNRDKKYSGSYESIAKVIYSVSTKKEDSMEYLFKTIVMSYLLKNGDGHLKNFGVLYDYEFKNINFAPAYDIVNTMAYIYNDLPALTMFGRKKWFDEKDLIRFGKNNCYLSNSTAKKYFQDCTKALNKIKHELRCYLGENKNFVNIGTKMLKSWEK